MADSSSDYNIGEALKSLVHSVLADKHTAMPAKVESYSYLKQKASVTPLLKRRYADGSETEYPKINNVPVVFPRSGEASLTFPVNKGDTVLLIFSEKSLDTWLSKGSMSSTKFKQTFSLSDAIAIPGIIPFSSVSYASNNSDVELNFKDQRIVIKSNGNIEIGASLGLSLLEAVIKGETFMSFFNSHFHVGNLGAPTTPPTVLMTAPLHLSSKVKVV